MDMAIAKSRNSIDIIDKEIFNLLKNRAELSFCIGKVKEKKHDPIYYKPEREAEIIRNIISINDSILSSHDVARIFYEIINVCRAVQKKLKIALFEKNHFIEKIIEVQFGREVNVFFLSSPEQMLGNIENIDYFFISKNVLKNNLSAFYKKMNNLYVCQKTEVSINNAFVSEQKKEQFFVFGRQKTISTGKDKTSLILDICSKKAFVSQLVQLFNIHNVKLKLITSCSYWEKELRTIFFVEISGHQDNQQVQIVLSELCKLSYKYMVLGSYPEPPLSIQV